MNDILPVLQLLCVLLALALLGLGIDLAVSCYRNAAGSASAEEELRPDAKVLREARYLSRFEPDRPAQPLLTPPATAVHSPP